MVIIYGGMQQKTDKCVVVGTKRVDTQTAIAKKKTSKCQG